MELRPAASADDEGERLLVAAFNLYDRDHSGSICRDELRDVLRATGRNPTEGKAGKNTVLVSLVKYVRRGSPSPMGCHVEKAPFPPAEILTKLSA